MCTENREYQLGQTVHFVRVSVMKGQLEFRDPETSVRRGTRRESTPLQVFSKKSAQHKVG